jgi:hypothetical protein
MTDDDDELLARLRSAAAGNDPPPALLVDHARVALSLRRLDAELAALVMDSELVEPGVTRAAGNEPRLLLFEAGGVSLELQVEPEWDGISLRGLVSGAGGEAVVHLGEQRRSAPIDADGWFTLSGLPGGTIRVELRRDDGAAVVTGWVLV